MGCWEVVDQADSVVMEALEEAGKAGVSRGASTVVAGWVEAALEEAEKAAEAKVGAGTKGAAVVGTAHTSMGKVAQLESNHDRHEPEASHTQKLNHLSSPSPEQHKPWRRPG